ncbi:MAG: hypothetical protein K2Q06_09695, partial [Parvularculaceae bacterium]|nr:hypothetical protein [Parvularculaceae bacterium]
MAVAALGPESAKTKDDAYLRAMAEFAAGDAKAAVLRLRSLDQALAADPRSRLLAAFAREASADISQAEIEFRRAAESAPRDPVVQDALADFLLRQGRSDDASEAIDALAALAPAAARARKAQLCERLGDVDSAFETLIGGDAARLPSRARILGAAAKDGGVAADLRLDALTEAAAALRSGEAVEPAFKQISPYSEEALAVLLIGELRLAAGDPEGAKKAFLKARPSKSFRAALGEARASAQGGDFATARKIIDAAFAARPDELRRRRAAARAAIGAGNAAGAVKLLNAAGDAVLGDDRAIAIMIEAAAADPAALGAFADRLARSGRASGAVAEAFLAAGRVDVASGVASRALLADAGDGRALSAYLKVMDGQSSAEAIAFLSALRRRSPDVAILQDAVERLTAGASLADVSGGVDKAAAGAGAR